MKLGVGELEHLVLGPRVVDPAGPRLQVHLAELPALARVVDALLEPALLLIVADREPVLDEDDARPEEHGLERRGRPQELLVLLVGAEAHDPLDAGPVVPAAVEEHDLAGRRQLGDVALEVPLRPLAVGRLGQRDHPHDARVGPVDDPLDRAALARGVPALEEHADPEALVDDPLLELDQLPLESLEVALVVRLAQPLVRHAERVGAHPLNRPLRIRSASISAISSAPETTISRIGHEVEVGVASVVVDGVEDDLHGVQPGALLVAGADDRPRGGRSCWCA